MEGIQITKAISIEAGELINLNFSKAKWHFKFKNNLDVESYGGWRLMSHEIESKTILGSRDLEEDSNPLGKLAEKLEDFEFVSLVFNSLRDTLSMQFVHMDKGRLSIELIPNSGLQENWRIIGEDFIDSDKKNIIKNL
jgi:hypothetical protein